MYHLDGTSWVLFQSATQTIVIKNSNLTVAKMSSSKRAQSVKQEWMEYLRHSSQQARVEKRLLLRLMLALLQHSLLHKTLMLEPLLIQLLLSLLHRVHSGKFTFGVVSALIRVQHITPLSTDTRTNEQTNNENHAP